MQYIILLVVLPHAFAWRGENEMDYGRTHAMTLEPGTTPETSVPLEEQILYGTSSGETKTVQSFSVPVVTPPAGQDQSLVIQHAGELFQGYMDELPLPPQENNCPTDQINSRAFVFAIGSIFNDDSRRTQKLKSDLATGRLDTPETVRPAMFPAPMTCQLFAVLKKGFRRMWTYPSGGKNRFWALSLHEDTAESPPVLGSLTEVDVDWFGMMRPREADYDVLKIPPDNVVMSGTSKSLRDMYPCDKLFVFGYGYHHPVANMPTGLSDIFRVENRIKNRSPFNQAPDKTEIPTLKLCELGQERVGNKTFCENMLMANYGHVLTQSYIDIIMAGILETGFTTKVGEFTVHGGASPDIISEHYLFHVIIAKIFASTTTWPVDEVKGRRVLFINDRACPRNGNPIYTPKEKLHAPHGGGISSSVFAKDIDKLYNMIDDAMKSFQDGQDMIGMRIEGEDVCEKLVKVTRWMDNQLEKEDSLWDLAYRRVPKEHEQLPAPAQSCQYEMA